jgi:hypothetical protein
MKSGSKITGFNHDRGIGSSLESMVPISLDINRERSGTGRLCLNGGEIKGNIVNGAVVYAAFPENYAQTFEAWMYLQGEIKENFDFTTKEPANKISYLGRSFVDLIPEE